MCPPARGSSDVAETLTTDAPASIRTTVSPGARLGRYLVIEEVGHGAMGLVLRGYDPKLQREVALKVLRTRTMSREGQERMIREARAMAQLSHPNVVAVYDVETDDGGRVVLAMEFVRGVSLDQWLESPHPWSEVVEHFIAAGEGLAAAHAVGLLHRDFKPANVLVGDRVRVTDFGLARAETGAFASHDADGPSGGDSLSVELTAAGTVMGTPAYMAPEQHEAAELTAAADQFALCVSLWRGLTGELPYPTGEGIGLEELVDAKRGGPPPWPRGSSVPHGLVVAIRRGLAPRPQDRWPSVPQLLDALRRASRRPARRLAVAGIAALVVVGVGAWALSRGIAAPPPCAGADTLIADAWGPSQRIAAEAAFDATGRPYAAAVWGRIAPRLDAYAARWRDQHAEACEATMVRHEQSSSVMDARMVCLQRARTELSAITGLLVEADGQVVERGDQLVETLPPLDRCEDIEGLLADVAPPSGEERQVVEAANAHVARATAAVEAGKLDDAEAAIEEATAMIEAVSYAPIHNDLRIARMRLLDARGEQEEAVEIGKQALREALRLGQWQQAFAVSRSLVFQLGFQLGRGEEALAFAETAWGLVERSGLPRATAEGQIRSNVANALSELGRLGEAADELQACLKLPGVAEGRRVGMLRLNLSRILQQLGRAEEAEQQARQAVASLSERLGPQHPAVGTALINLGNALHTQERYVEAEQAHRRALEVLEAAYGPDHPDLARVRVNLSLTLHGQGRIEEALAENEASRDQFEAAYPVGHPALGLVRLNHALLLDELGRSDDAVSEMRDAIDYIVEGRGPDFPMLGQIRTNRAAVLTKLKRVSEAETELREALRLYTKAFEPDNPTLLRTRAQLADLLTDQQRHAEALPLLDASWETAQLDSVPLRQRLDAGQALAEALWAAGEDAGRARSVALRVRQFAVDAGPEHADALREVDRWLAEHDVASP